MKTEDVMQRLKDVKVEEALEAADKVEDKKELAIKLTEFAGALTYLTNHPLIAEVILKKSLLLNFDHAPTHYNLGVLYTTPPMVEENKSNVEKAERAYKMAIKLDPKHYEARYNLALIYYFTGRVEEAEKEYGEITASIGDDVRFRELGVLLMQLKKTK
ncbi:MAG: tetratricopeptide repeat protein [Candidatus Altiarchaeota archaeon]